MRISDWSSDVCSSDLYAGRLPSAYIACTAVVYATDSLKKRAPLLLTTIAPGIERSVNSMRARRSEEHTSELQSLMRISYAVFCLKKKNNKKQAKYKSNIN